MKSIAITVFVSLVVLVLVLEGITFQVREPESVLVTTFGKPTRQIPRSPACISSCPRR